MRKERTPAEAAEIALCAADRSADRVMVQLRQQARERALATLLAVGLYPEGAAMARAMGYDEGTVYDLLSTAAEEMDQDPYLVAEAVYGLDAALID